MLTHPIGCMGVINTVFRECFPPEWVEGKRHESEYEDFIPFMLIYYKKLKIMLINQTLVIKAVMTIFLSSKIVQCKKNHQK